MSDDPWWKRAAKGLGNALFGGGGAPTYGGTTMPTGYNPGMPLGPVPGAGGGYPGAPVTPFVSPRTSVYGGPSDGIGRRVGRFVTDNPELVLGVAGAAASVYGARQAGQAEDDRIALEREMMESNRTLATRGLDLRQQEMDRAYETQMAEKERRRRAYRELLEMRAGGPPPIPKG